MICFREEIGLGTFMNRSLHLGIVVAMALHMACGCCLHHAHLITGSPHDTDRAVASCRPTQHDRAGEDHTCADPPAEKPCHADRCVFTRSDSDGAPGLTGQGVVCLARWRPESAARNGIHRTQTDGGPFRSPTPLHVLNQAFLL